LAARQDVRGAAQSDYGLRPLKAGSVIRAGMASGVRAVVHPPHESHEQKEIVGVKQFGMGLPSARGHASMELAERR